FLMVFYAPVGRQGRYRIWEPQEGWPFAEHRYKLPSTNVRDYCERPQVVSAMMSISASEQVEPYFLFLNRILSPPMEPSPEWVATFEARSTRLPEEADTFDAELTLAYPGRHQQRTVLQGMVAAPVPPGERDGPRRFLLTGEIVRADELFDSFRFRFEAPPEGATDLVPLVFQRYLRPGPATLLLKVEDLDGRRFARLERTLEIPHTVEAAGTPGIEDSELFRFLAEAEAATALGERNIRLLPPDGAAVHTGKVRFDTLAVGDFERVEFSLDGQPIMTKNRPPFSVELDLGNLPGMQRLRVSALDALGTEVASDEILLNPGGQSFRVRWLEPRANRRYRGSTRAVIDVQIPDGETLDRLELFIGDHLAATLFQPPFVQPLAVPDDGLAYLRAVAHLADGHSTEDVVFINADGPVETVDVRLVEIYAGVYDRRGRPVLDLAEEDFTVTESDEPRTLQRFEHRRDLPIQTVLLIDTSASMEDSLEQVTDTARRYLDQTLRPEDRAALVAFHHQPRVESRFTNDPEVLSQALGALRAEGGTALYDSLVFALHYFHGIRGHKALLLLSDGEDESSGFDFERTLEYAQHTGVTLYTIGLAASKLDRDAKKVLRTLAEETGGRSWMVDDLAELGPIYDRIELELRSRYLLAYQASGDRDETAFRPVSVEVAGDRSLEVRAPSGYFP
ncbi:MAG: VWA domain-containing protein, partial [Acidobacteriota bacterium]